MKYATALFCLLLTACSIGPTKYDRIQDSATVTVHIVDELPVNKTPNVLAETHCMYGKDSSGKVVVAEDCKIYIKKELYPRCLAHELRHVFEGDWHQGRHSTEDC